ncbi:RNA polymerase sigma factor [Actinoplanes sp. NPDC051633]|uniref:RNA polymerase sigma factor n=1 Tax=Actinoplanes sp. NPDC051633 TaxID=3155670 RepID=UPI0034365231
MTEPDTTTQFTSLYERHHRQVYGYAVTRAGRDLADEVVAETFLIAWRRFGALPRREPLPWLLGTARNVVRERYRAEERQRRIAAEMTAWVEEAGADVADTVTDRAAVLAALAGLTEDDRELLTLTAWHGLEPRAAARVIGCTTATYFVRLHRARRRLTEAMAAADLQKEPIR